MAALLVASVESFGLTLQIKQLLRRRLLLLLYHYYYYYNYYYYYTTTTTTTRMISLQGRVEELGELAKHRWDCRLFGLRFRVFQQGLVETLSFRVWSLKVVRCLKPQNTTECDRALSVAWGFDCFPALDSSYGPGSSSMAWALAVRGLGTIPSAFKTCLTNCVLNFLRLCSLAEAPPVRPRPSA